MTNKTNSIMKIIVEIPNKSIDMAKAVMMTGCDTKEQEYEIREVCERMKTSKDPMVIDFDETDFQRFKTELRQMYMAFTTLTISAMKMKEIYEGDIIVQHTEDMPDIRGEVVYDEVNARFGMAYTSYWDSGSVTHFDTLERVKCYSDRNRELKYEVIGNVHDNPDLMLEKDINSFKCEM